MKLADKTYGPFKCCICREWFSSNHPRLLRCAKCFKEKCSDCGCRIRAGLRRMMVKARKCARCWPRRLGSKRNAGQYIEVKTKSGWKYEHRVVTEKTINRRLRPGEVVHHKDGNPSNNAPGNLVVCRSLRDHLDRFHKDDLKNPPLHHNGRRKKGSPGWKPIVKV